MLPHQHPTNISIGGMLVGYYLICPRKAWLSMRGLWMEQESDDVALGRLLDATSYDRRRKHLMLAGQEPRTSSFGRTSCSIRSATWRRATRRS